MKHTTKKVAALAFVMALACMLLAACSGQQASSSSAASSSGQSSASSAEQSASSSAADKASDTGSSAEGAKSLKDDPEEAKRQVEIAMQYQLEQAYGDKVNDARITVEKVYTTEEEQANEMLKDYNLGPDEVAFEVKYELHPADGVDVNELLAATGDYDEKTGWVVDKYNVGILRPNAGGDPAYVVTNFGTGF